MVEDYFSRVCRDPNTRIVRMEFSVEALWHVRFDLAHPKKKRRLSVFYQSFQEVMEKLNEGHVYTVEEMEKTDYWRYLRGYHPEWMMRHRPNGIWHRFLDGIRLFHDIKERGMINPILVLAENGRMFIYRGYRRFVILKVLGTERMRVDLAIVHNSISSE